MGKAPGVFRAVWSVIDGFFRAISKGLQKNLRRLKMLRAFLLFSAVLLLVAAGLSIWRPEYAPYAIALMALYVSIPLFALAALVGLPLKAKSIARLIAVGYPDNIKEFLLRIVARKLHEQSIESEELLLDTALNESKKMLRKYRAKVDDVLDTDDKPDKGPSQE